MHERLKYEFLGNERRVTGKLGCLMVDGVSVIPGQAVAYSSLDPTIPINSIFVSQQLEKALNSPNQVAKNPQP